MTDYVVACSAGIANEELLVDLNSEEESAEVPIVTIAMLPRTEKLVMCMTECRLNLDRFQEVNAQLIVGHRFQQEGL